LLQTLKVDLHNSVGAWLRGGPEDDVVLSTRVRLARNVPGYPFLSKASPREIARTEEILRAKIQACEALRALHYYRLDQLDPLLRQLLVERHLIGKEFAAAQWVRGVAFDMDESLSVMVNEEDHLRMQAVFGGLQLERAFEAVNRVDDALAQVVPYAFSADYGYLTACPTNTGTGMRASTLMHLPAVIMTRRMDGVIELCRRFNLVLRGLYGEGTHGSGDLYQLSNRCSLGLTEQEILRQVAEGTGEVMAMEREARHGLMEEHERELRGRIERALELLTQAAAISSEEALYLLSQVRMGVYTGVLKQVGVRALNELVLLTLPAHLQTIEGRRVGRLKRNELRAGLLKQKLALN